MEKNRKARAIINCRQSNYRHKVPSANFVAHCFKFCAKLNLVGNNKRHLALSLSGQPMPNSFGKQAPDMASMFSALEIPDDMLAFISASTVKKKKRERLFEMRKVER